MQPGQFPLILYRGDSRHWQFKLWKDVEKTDPVDLTGVTAKSEIRDRPGGRTVVAMECSIDLPNIINLSLLASVSRNVPATGNWDLQLTYDTGDIVTILAGTVTVTPDVTDSGPAAGAAAPPLAVVAS